MRTFLIALLISISSWTLSIAELNAPAAKAGVSGLWLGIMQVLAAEASADGSTTVYFSPKQPDRVKRGNWIQTAPKKGWFTILRFYSPLEPFFTKAWRPTESSW
jgi:hypothetical protein